MTTPDYHPRHPLYIPSKGRAKSRQTVKALERMGVPYKIVIEEREYSDYVAVIDKKNILVLDKSYQENYETCDDLGLTKSVGAGAARNFAWDHSIANGATWHWVMDDNIRHFRRFQNNLKIPVETGAFFRVMEDFCERYENIGTAGPQYCMFVVRKKKRPPLTFNTRIYSCNLIRNDIGLRWRGRHNEDTDLSLRVLKKDLCTVLFNCFLQEKAPTMTMGGGNTEDFYAKEGRLPATMMLARLHPDVTKIVTRFGRVHHLVDYKRFASNKLILKKEYRDMPKGPVEYGMKFIKKGSRPCLDQ